MSRWFATILAAAVLVLGNTAAQAAPLTVSQTVDIQAPPAKVWKIIGDFNALAAWHPAIASSPADHGNDIGSVRTLTLKAEGNPHFTEKLTKYSAADFTYSYDITPTQKVIPVVGYHSTITVTKTDTGSTVTWNADFFAGSATNDKGAIDVITGIFRQGLDNLKTKAEKK
jgi:uncharacterized protein YndB with AHSA1/START domain